MTDEKAQAQTAENKPAAAAPSPDVGQPAQEPSLIERAEKIRDDMIASEKRTFEKIAQFEKQLAEKILSGRAEIVPSKSQEEKDKEEAAKTVARYFD